MKRRFETRVRDADDAAHDALDAEGMTPRVPIDAPEADSLEQAAGVEETLPDARHGVPADVPEADALEQQMQVGDGDDYDRL